MPLRADEQVNLKGKMHPLWKGVLREAMENGLLGLETKIIQLPAEANKWLAVVEATATFAGPDGRDRVFTDLGDAGPTNCTANIAPHAIRMASTRAKGRVLRDALGIGEAMAEEMTEMPAAEQAAQQPTAPVQREEAPAPVNGGLLCYDCGQPITTGQNTVSMRVYKKPLCPRHQQEAGQRLGKIASNPAV